MGKSIYQPLSAPVVSRALREGTPGILKDTGSLALKVTDKNKGSWIFRGRLAGTGKVVEVVCGKAPEMTLSAARTQRDKIRLQLKEGINPNALRKAELAKRDSPASAGGITFGAVADEYFALRTDMSPKGHQTDRGRVKNHMANILEVPVADIDRLKHLKPLIDTLVRKGKHEQARRVGGLIGRIMNFALDAGYIKYSPADRLVRLVPRQRGARAHHAAVTTVDGAASLFKRLWEYADSGRSVSYLTAALKLSCYVPLRNSNLIAARWEHIDMDKGVWLFPETKNARSYMVPLTRQVRGILEELLSYRENDWCFPSGTSKTGHISNAGMTSLLRMAGVSQEEHCLHGFRSTFETIALNHGLPKALCERLLFHVAGGKVEQAYNRATYDQALVPVLQWWDDTVDALRLDEAIPELPSNLRELYR